MAAVAVSKLRDGVFTAVGTLLAVLVLLMLRAHVSLVALPSAALASVGPVRRVLSATPLLWFAGSLVLVRAAGSPIARDGGSAAWIAALVGGAVAFDLAATALATTPSRLEDATRAAERHPLWSRLPVRNPEDRVLLALAGRWTPALAAFVAVTVATAGWPGAWVLAVPYAILWARGAELVGLLEHTDVHQAWSRPTPSGSWVARRVHALIGFGYRFGVVQLYGLAPGFYAVSHLGSHHVENNGPEDYQTTVGYDRTSFFEFGRATGSLLASTWFGFRLFALFRRNGRTRFWNRLLVSLTVHAATVGLALWWVPELGALLLAGALIMPVFHAIAAFGQHGLFDARDPTNVYRSAWNIDLPSDDHALFGEAYHAQHHLTPTGWFRYHERAAERAADYAREGAMHIALDNPEADLLRAFWRGDPDRLYPRVRQIGADAVTREAFAAWFWERVRPEGPPVSRFVRAASVVAAAVLP